jgi:hypothetical protein
MQADAGSNRRIRLPGEFSDDGVSIAPTPESLAALDAWYGEHRPGFFLALDSRR